MVCALFNQSRSPSNKVQVIRIFWGQCVLLAAVRCCERIDGCWHPLARSLVHSDEPAQVVGQRPLRSHILDLFEQCYGRFNIAECKWSERGLGTEDDKGRQACGGGKCVGLRRQRSDVDLVLTQKWQCLVQLTGNKEYNSCRELMSI